MTAVLSLRTFENPSPLQTDVLQLQAVIATISPAASDVIHTVAGPICRQIECRQDTHTHTHQHMHRYIYIYVYTYRSAQIKLCLFVGICFLMFRSTLFSSCMTLCLHNTCAYTCICTLCVYVFHYTHIHT